jgi:serine O-acetyltransferase
MRFWSVVGADLNAYYLKDLGERSAAARVLAFLRAWLDIDFRIVFHFRIFQRLTSSALKPIGLLLYFRQKSRYGVDLSPWCVIAPGLRLQHAFNLVIGPDVRIGANCVMFNGVTLGNARPDIPVQRMPMIGDNCILGTGAKIFGTIRVDSDLIVGANTVVKDDLIKGGAYFQQMEREGRVRVRRPAPYAFLPQATQ